MSYHVCNPFILQDPGHAEKVVCEHNRMNVSTKLQMPFVGAKFSCEYSHTKLWRNGEQLLVKFEDPAGRISLGVKERVAGFASEWCMYGNIRLLFFDPSISGSSRVISRYPVSTNQPQVRVSFNPGASWSAVGTDCLCIPSVQVTTNIGLPNLTDNTPDWELRRVVLHLFGHVLGLTHEIPFKEKPFDWNLDSIRTAFSGPPGFQFKTNPIEKHFIEYISQERSNFEKFDVNSVMVFPIPRELTLSGYCIDWSRNSDFSDNDKNFMRRNYPKRVSTDDLQRDRELQMTRATVDSEKKNKLFVRPSGLKEMVCFDVFHEDHYAITCHGQQYNVVMSLFAPSDPSLVITADTNTFQRRNSRIIKYLQPGRYYLRVMVENPIRTGFIKLAIKSLAFSHKKSQTQTGVIASGMEEGNPMTLDAMRGVLGL